MLLKSLRAVLLIILFAVSGAAAQSYSLWRRVSIEEPRQAVLDPLGQLYLLTRQGKIVKYSPDGELLYEYQDVHTQSITMLDASTSLRLMAFYQDAQQYQFFDRTLAPTPILPLAHQVPDYFSLASASADGGLWLWNAAQLQLKKYVPAMQNFTTEIEARYYLQTQANIRQIAEYQNRLYLSDRGREILVFDILGNYLQKLPCTDVTRFGFWGEELYWQNGDFVYYYHLYEGKTRKVSLPHHHNPNDVRAVFLQHDQMVMVLQQELFIYRR